MTIGERKFTTLQTIMVLYVKIAIWLKFYPIHWFKSWQLEAQEKVVVGQQIANSAIFQFFKNLNFVIQFLKVHLTTSFHFFAFWQKPCTVPKKNKGTISETSSTLEYEITLHPIASCPKFKCVGMHSIFIAYGFNSYGNPLNGPILLSAIHALKKEVYKSSKKRAVVKKGKMS